MSKRVEMITDHYFSYLLRIWKGESPLPGNWHASLEDPSTHLMVHFNTLDELIEFIRQMTFSAEKTNPEER